MTIMTNYHEEMIPVDLDIDMLRCFVEVTNTGSFTQAGYNIGLTQSGVSVKIRRLEERLSTQIFDRTNKRLSLTLEGELLLNYARRILSVHDEAVSRLTKPEASGELKVGLIDYFLPELLPSLLSKFSKQHPNIHLEVQTGFGIYLLPLYEKGELDLVVAGKDDYEGDCQILNQEPLIWVVKNGYDDSIVDEPIQLALLPSPCSFRTLATESLDKADRKWEVLFTGTSTTSIQAAVQAGMGLSILPQGAITKGIKRAPANWNLPELPMYSLALFTDDEKKNNARDVFVHYLLSEIHNLQDNFS